MNKILHNYYKLPYDIKQNILKFIDYTDKNNALFEFFKYERNIFKNKYTPHHIFIDNYNNLSLSQLEFFYMNINIPYEFIINNQNLVIWDKYVQNKYIHFSIFNNISYILPSIWYNESLTNEFIIKNKNILFQNVTYLFYFTSSQNIWKKYPILCQDLVVEFINHFNANLIKSMYDNKYVPLLFLLRHFPEYNNFKEIWKHIGLNQEYLYENFEKINWKILAVNPKLDSSFIFDNLQKIDDDCIINLCNNDSPPLDILSILKNKIPWIILSKNKNVHSDFFEYNIDYVDWNSLSQNEGIQIDFFIKYFYKLFTYFSNNKNQYLYDNSHFELLQNQLV